MIRDPALVLVAGDDLRNVPELAGPIEVEGLRVVAREGAGAGDLLEQAGGNRCDLVILAASRGDADGAGLLRRLTGDARFRDVPVIVLAAAVTPRQVRDGLAAGAFCCLARPCDTEVLRTAVRAALAERVARRARSEGARGRVPPLLAPPGGRFELRTLEEARWLSALLAAEFPDPATAGLGLLELIVNAVEHGNLGISTEEKSRLLSHGAWEEEVNRRLDLGENIAKRVRVDLRRDARSITVAISDEGPGFEWERFSDLDPARALAPNGRGIALARRLAFPDLEYLGCGNQVRVVVALPPGADADAGSSEHGVVA